MNNREHQESSNLDKRDLLPRHVNGAPDAFREFVMLYEKPVYSYLVRLGIPEIYRDDLFQEIFLKIHRFAKSYNPKKALPPWVFTIVANTTKSFYRKNKIKKVSLDNLELVSKDDLAENYEQKEKINHIAKSIQKLPYKQKEALLLNSVEGIEIKEVAKILKVPVNTAKSHIRRARISLSEELKNQEKISLLKVS